MYDSTHAAMYMTLKTGHGFNKQTEFLKFDMLWCAQYILARVVQVSVYASVDVHHVFDTDTVLTLIHIFLHLLSINLAKMNFNAVR